MLARLCYSIVVQLLWTELDNLKWVLSAINSLIKNNLMLNRHFQCMEKRNIRILNIYIFRPVPIWVRWPSTAFISYSPNEKNILLKFIVILYCCSSDMSLYYKDFSSFYERYFLTKINNVNFEFQKNVWVIQICVKANLDLGDKFPRSDNLDRWAEKSIWYTCGALINCWFLSIT